MNSSKTAKTQGVGKPAEIKPAEVKPAPDASRARAPNPAAGAHAAAHLTNEDATPGSGALPSHAHASGKEVDGGAG